MTVEERKVLEHQGSCLHSNCSSSDAMSIWSYPDSDRPVDGFCFSCNQYVPPDMWEESVTGKPVRRQPREVKSTSVEEILEYPVAELKDRNISKQVAEKYGVRIGLDETTREPVEHYYPHYYRGKLVAWQVRSIKDKKFKWIGDTSKMELFGQHLFSEAGKMLVVTEGHCDAMAGLELALQKGKNYRHVSLPNGANLKHFKENLEWIESFENVMIAFDMDEPGQKAAKEAVSLLSLGKGRIISLPEKDLNDLWNKKGVKAYFKALNEAQSIKPPGIVSGADTWDRLMNRPKVDSLPYPPDWKEMNEMTYGTRLGELDTWTSGTGMGKTQVLKELIYHTLTASPDPSGIVFLEEPLEDTVEALMGMHLNKRIHLPDVAETVSEEEKRQAWLATSGSNRLHFADAWGSMETGNLLAKIRYLAKGLGCKRIYLDHLHIAISEYADDGDERTRIDSLMSKLKALTRELNIWLGLVVHLRKATSGGPSFEQGAVPSLDDLRGSASIKQLSNGVYALARNQQAADEDVRNTTSLHVLKSRFTGRTGPAGFLRFCPDTGRMMSCGDPEEIQAFGGDSG